MLAREPELVVAPVDPNPGAVPPGQELPPKPGTPPVACPQAQAPTPAAPDDEPGDAGITNEPGPAPEVEAAVRTRFGPLRPAREISGMGAEIRLPLWDLPVATRSCRMHFSLLSQIDGLSFKCLGSGARVGRDVFSPSSALAVCPVFGHEPWMSTGSFCGLYYCDFRFMPSVVAKVASDKGYGIFVVPVVPGARPALALVQKGHVAGQVVRYAWYDYLMSKARLVFDLPAEAFTDASGAPVRHPHGVQAVFAQFGTNGRFKNKPRPERRFRLQIIPAVVGPQLGVTPTLIHMASPLAWDSVPGKRDDVLPACPAFVVHEGVVPPTPLKSRWESVLPEFAALAADYPCPHVAKLAMECLTTGLNTYKGTLDKPILHPESAGRDNVEELAKRATIMKEVVLGRIAGPFPSCPFPNARVCPITTREKDPYDPESTRLRLISDFSRTPRHHPTGSINDLCWSPKLLSYHATAGHIRDTLAWLFQSFGAGVVAWTADIPSCFRLNHLNAALLSLFVYRVQTKEHGDEWFSDLATPFGWGPAEWGWQCDLALVSWAFRKAALEAMISYVDNFFYLTHPSAAGPGVPSTFAAIEAVFVRLNIPLHEQMCGTHFKGLGWMWDTSSPSEPPVMLCAADKQAHLCRKLAQWVTATELPYSEIESIIGFLAWISEGFPIGKPHLAYLRADLAYHASGRGRAADSKGVPQRKQTVALTKRAREALRFWHKFFPSWDGRCTVFLDFGPMAGPDVLWRLDASTDWGMGAFMWILGEPEGFYILHEWTQAERDSAFVVERESTGIFEAMAAVRCAVAFAELSSGKRVLMETDNESLSRGVARGYSKNHAMMKLIRRVCKFAAKAQVHLRAAHIKGSHATTHACRTLVTLLCNHNPYACNPPPA